ncbi:MAG: DUF2817 domain-containing protein [Acidobacteria bacterium]|nr:MAG: DUF2817 domain-containing protein [Acidobacteriota bacterium]
MSAHANYFSPDYSTARSRFRQMVEAAGGRLDVLPLEARGPAGENLGIDIGSFGAENPRRVLLHSSGLHGVEGFAGSAIQLQFLDSLPPVPAETAFVIVHVLNPYGMAWLRRVNENNVDLNRNCLGNTAYAGAPSAYVELESFLNPQSPPTSDLFTLKAIWLILRHGMPALKQAVVGGQYEYPKGLFFGGKQLQQGLERYESFLARRLTSAKQVVAIDVHTGLGKYGEDTLLVDTEQYDTLRRRFGERVTRSDPHESPAYQVRGALESMIFRVLRGAHVDFLRQEFGTYGPVKVLQALRQENRAHYYDDGRSGHPAKTVLREIFCPADESWRQSVLKRGGELLSQALAEL